MSVGGLYYPAYTPGFGSKPRLQTIHPFHNLLAAGSHLNNQWSGGSGHSDYGLDNSDYDYHSGPSVHVPSGGSYSYHATAGTGYGPPAAPAIHPPPKPVAHSPAGGKKGIFGGGKHGSSAMSALTLLSFLFFINLLQGCIKDHMDAMNPTVMVMTTNIIRNRFNKMGELNSREQSSSYASNAANIVMQPQDLIQAAAAQSGSVTDTIIPSVNFQSAHTNRPISFNRPQETAIPQPSAPHMSSNPEADMPISYEYAKPKPHYDPHKPDAHDQTMQHQHILSYANQTLTVAQAPPYKLTPVEQHYNFHHTEYNAQSAPLPVQTSANAPLYTTSSRPFYEHQHPSAVKPFNIDYSSHYGGPQQDYDFRQKYEATQQQQNSHFLPAPSTSNAHPWSTNVQTSSVVSGPYRRASVIAVSPKTKWIAVPAKIIDRSNFGTSPIDDGEEHFEHHDDRDVFHSSLN